MLASLERVVSFRLVIAVFFVVFVIGIGCLGVWLSDLLVLVGCYKVVWVEN